MAKRFKTDYPGVYYIEARRRSGGVEKVYYVRFKKNGAVYEEKAGRQYEDDMTPAKASLFRADRIEGRKPSGKEVREAKKAVDKKWTVSRLWKEYTAQRSPKGLAQDRSRFKNYVEPSFGKKEPADIVPLDVDRLRLSMLKEGKSKQHVKLTLALLRRVCRFGERKGLCPGLKFQIEVPKVFNETTEDLTGDQLKRLLQAIKKDDHPQAGDMMKLALFTGMRRGELFKLKWDHIDFERGFIHLIDPKNAEDQKIPMNNQARALLKSIPFQGSPFVFPGRDGKQRTEIRRVTEIRDAASLPRAFRPLHGLRHVYASMLASSGKVDMFTLQKLMTHRDPGMTQRYAHLRDDALRNASTLAGKIISSASRKGKKRVSKIG